MLPEWYNNYKQLIEQSLENYLVEYFSSEKNKWLNLLKDSALYSVKWGKRIRSIFALEFYLSFTKKDINSINTNDDIFKFCTALELLHAFSLIHDDLPAMDNDILRRWEPTVWKKYWEASAILVWDMLNSMAFEILWNIKNSKPILHYFGQAVWIKWMLWWQVLDLYYEKNPEELTLDNLIEVHNKKTWALIQMSVLWWILIAEKEANFVKDKESNNIKKYLDFWEKIGLAFQVKDDLLDVEGNFEETGKSVGDWEEKGFVYFMWIEKTKDFLEKLIFDCKSIIKDLNSEKLNFLVNYIGNRKS